MVPNKENLKICPQGHEFYKSSECPVCPKCEAERKPDSGFLSEIPAPARRALENKDITTLSILAQYSEKEILDLHGMGPSSIPKLKKALNAKGLSFKNK